MNTKPNFIIIKPLGTVTTGGWIVGGIISIDSTWNICIRIKPNCSNS